MRKSSLRYKLSALVAGYSLLSITSCSTVKQTLTMEQRVFLRIPGNIPKGPIAPVGGWHFRHVLEGPSKREDAAQWYVAWNVDGRDEVSRFGQFQAWGRVTKLAPELAAASLERFGAYPQLIEPGLVYKEHKGAPVHIGPASQGIPLLEIDGLPGSAWPTGRSDSQGFHDPVWHQDDHHSQLAAAREMVRKKTGGAGSGIRIGFLDTGFDGRQVALPKHLIAEVEGEAVQVMRRSSDADSTHGKMDFVTPAQIPDSGHATGTIGLLAGRKVRIGHHPAGGHSYVRDQIVEIGGAPDATVVAVRIAPVVASLSTANLAYGIDYASRVQKCDVISMSHGGSPSMMWTDAVNAAYDRGTAMFAATGDFFPVPLVPGRLSRLGLVVPSSAVYPASFRRVMGVAGVTEDGSSYGQLGWLQSLKHPFEFMRGSYGADGVRRSLINGSLLDEPDKVDVASRENRKNVLRAHPVSAYSPNVPWLSRGSTLDDHEVVNRVQLDGAGTSAATPQASAAAANWLAYHRKEIESAGAWNNWRKAEAVYLAMLQTANRPWASGEAPVSQQPDVMLGAGSLRAKDMLGVSFKDALEINGETLKSPLHYPKDHLGSEGGMPRDFYDSQRSFFDSVFALNRNGFSSHYIRKSADIQKEVYRSSKDHQSAMEQLYFNMLLVQQFQFGHQPLKSDFADEAMGPNEPTLKRKAKELAGTIARQRIKAHNR